MRTLLVGLLACAALTGCQWLTSPAGTFSSGTSQSKGLEKEKLFPATQVVGVAVSRASVWRFEDTEVGAVCYVMVTGVRPGGVFCLDRKPPIE